MAPQWSPLPVVRRVTVLSGMVVGAAGVAGAVFPSVADRAGPALLVVAGLLGLPHGAVDHLALGWARGRAGAAGPLILSGYAAAALACVAATLLAPRPALVVLLALSVAHFAEGEAAFDRLRCGRGLALPAWAVGTAIVVLPIELRPAASRTLLAALDVGLPALLAVARLPLLAITALLVVAGLVAALRAGERWVAAELALVALAATVGPPLVVFAAWFAGWHAPRHLVRLAALEPSGDGPERFRRLAWGAAAPTAIAVAALAVLAAWSGGLPGAVLVGLLALTVPHAAVVAQLDRLAAGSVIGRYASRPASSR